MSIKTKIPFLSNDKLCINIYFTDISNISMMPKHSVQTYSYVKPSQHFVKSTENVREGIQGEYFESVSFYFHCSFTVEWVYLATEGLKFV